ncbi:hypothetical protein FRC10_012245 [Ceratobasidium sp. 414]|nr:hypothetical protein FRC10_012245 [Ceratobasidium sp. 414]
MPNFLQALLAAAPPGESPYAYVAAWLLQCLPVRSHWFFWMLAAGSFVSAVSVSSALSLNQADSFFDRPTAQESGFEYCGVPYLVPNAIMSFLVFNGIFALLMQPYVWIAVTSTLSQLAWRNMTLLSLTIAHNFQTLDHQWMTNNKTIDSGLLNDTLALADPLVHRFIDSEFAFVRNAITCGAWYFLCFLFFTPSAIWLLYIIRRTLTHKLQFVTRMPTSEVDIRLSVPVAGFSESNSHADAGDHGGRESWKPLPPVGLPLPHLPTPLTGDGSNRGQSSAGTTPTSAAFLVRAADVGQQPAVVSPTSLEHGDLAHGGLDHSHHPHDPGGRPWGLNVTSTTKTTKKLQTAYYSAMLQFATTGFCLAVASGLWIWAAVDRRVLIDLDVHAAAIMMTVWVYPLIGIAVNLFICIRLRAIGSSPTSPKPKSKLMGYLQEVWASSTRSAQGTGRS